MIAAVAGLSCAHGPIPPCDTPPPFYVRVKAGERLNPDASGRPLPTLVQVLQLKGLAKVEDADFSALFQHAADALGPDLLRTDEFTVDPGSNEGRWFERDPKATQVVALAVVRQPSGIQWRATQSLAPVLPEACVPAAPGSRTGAPRYGDTQLGFVMDEYRIEREGAPDEATNGDKRK